MKNLSYYLSIIPEDLQGNEDALMGYALELAVKDYLHKPLTISGQGHVDVSMTIEGALRRVEVKQNGGDLIRLGSGSSYIAYAIYIDPEQPLCRQFGYIMPMKTFLSCGYELNHIRKEKTSARGYVKTSLQTLYVYKGRDKKTGLPVPPHFHGKKAFKLADLWEDSGAIPFEDFFC